MEKFGYYFSQIWLDIKNFSNENKDKIKRFAQSSKHVHNLLFCSTKPNCVIQLFHKEESELRETIQQIKNLFPEEILDLDFMLISEDQGLVNACPFL